jgi:hypothetical protein
LSKMGWGAVGHYDPSETLYKFAFVWRTQAPKHVFHDNLRFIFRAARSNAILNGMTILRRTQKIQR